MENKLTIVDMKRHHCGMMARKIREEQLHPSFDDQGGIHRVIVNHFNKSYLGKSAFYGNEIIAMGGIQKNFCSNSSFAWLSISRNLKNLKSSIVLSIIKEIKKHINNDRNIVSVINITDETSVRFAKFFGFKPINNEENKNDFVIMKIQK